ncbi:histidine kinase N-terminal 7TM domain-containing protein [Bacillus weihaiensis]|uniref:GGDEF domain-containing protein n=1 Tax=Bacillus weihaiensis TaxID=1547283 RepID=A0A1L3MNV1_9BACI|nr:histidine kinase N-terminal 7TM domain-containing protein [Bacillus weihaiensis]APH03914.1 hypothetical protein A9C19_03575 [Bacillus weihaiensis]
MPTDILIYIVLMAVAGVLNILLGVYAYNKREKFRGSKTFILICVFTSIYTFGHAFELASQELNVIVFWTYFQYIGIPYLAPLSLILVIQYTGLEKFLTKWNRRFLFFIPALTTCVVWTNHWHNQFYHTIFLKTEIYPMIQFVIGPWYIVHGSYTFGCMLAGGLILLHYWRQTKSTYWKQIFVLLLSIYLPLVSAFLYLLGYTPYGMDPVPVVMSLTSIMYIWAFLSTSLLELAPIARGLIFDSMRDGVLVLDSTLRIVDFNHAATKLIANLDDQSIGQEIHSLWKGIDSDRYFFPSIHHYNQKEEYELEWTGKHSSYQIRSTPVRKKTGVTVGSTIVIADVTEQKQLHNKLIHMAYMDGLTGILNRRAFLDKSVQLMEEHAKQDDICTMILFDIDYFKKINDTYGHHIGDEAILHVVSVCKQFLQPKDLFGRYGGEEFVICLPSANLIEGIEYAELLRVGIENTPLEMNHLSIPMTASFGVTEALRHIPIEEVLRNADLALYESKKQGRNVVHMAKDSKVILHANPRLLNK